MSDLALGVPSPVSKKYALAAESPAPALRKNALAAESPAPVSGKNALAKVSHPKVFIRPALFVATISFDFRTSDPTKRPLSAVQTSITQAFRRIAFTELTLVLGERTHSLAVKSATSAVARTPDGTH